MNFHREMVRIKLEKRAKRRRAENWSVEERNLLRNLVTDRLDIIENKSTDTATNMHKLEAWKEIWERFILLNQRPRSVQKLREQWKRLKARPTSKEEKEEGHDTSCQSSSNRSASGGSNTAPAGDPLTIDQQHDYSYKNIPMVSMNPAESVEGMKPRKMLRAYRAMEADHRDGGSSSNHDYRRSMLELNKLVKKQITSSALAEHELVLEQLRQEFNNREQRAQEQHALHCEHLRLKQELMRLEIEIRKKQLNDYVI